jgi:hypothetical protein
MAASEHSVLVVLRTIPEKFAIEGYKDLSLIFIDLTEAYDNVTHSLCDWMS